MLRIAHNLVRPTRAAAAALGAAVLSASLGVVLGACGDDAPNDAPEEGLPFALPTGFPAPPVPDENPITAEKAELGRYLFYDARLSGNGEQSCGSCHFQELAFSDGRDLPLGSTGEQHPRNASGLTNAAYNATLTWANPLLTDLETQILIPLFGEHPIEMGATGREEEILDRLRADPLYGPLFDDAFPSADDPVTWDNVVQSLATFVRTMISGNAPFDRFVYQGDRDALSESARRGMGLFFSEELECHHCHGGFNFSESSIHASSVFDAVRFHNTGLYNVDGEGAYPSDNTGLFEVSGDPADMGRFRPPTLRNVEVSAPYMHDGSVATLEDVIRLYEAGGRLIEDGPNAGDGRESPLKSGFVPGFTLTDQERDDLVAFLHALTDEQFLSDPRYSDPFQ